jgi:23S rRNA pseudouridine2605 synthase
MAHRSRPPRPSHDSQHSPDEGRGERLQKVLAAAGIGSRRDCEDLIREGRVEVDRRVVTELGTRVDPGRQEIRVDGESLRRTKRLYFAVNKPVGVVSTNRDPSGRTRVVDLVPTDERVFPVGRLDRSSEGLILVTNDGEFANRLTHPRYGVEKTYLVRVAGAADLRKLDRLKKGVHLAEGFARAQSIAVKKRHGNSTELLIVLNEGRNREIRRILARVGHKVLTLKRVAVGNVKLGDLEPGAWRRLTHQEVESLLGLAKEMRRREKKRGKPRRPAAAQPAAEGPATGADQYVQKQALLEQPLSLDDLLRDDLDEGPQTAADFEPTAEGIEDATSQGGVIDYEDHASRPQQPAGRRHFDKRPRSQHRRRGSGQQSPQREELEPRPRESFGKKRGGKRVLGPLEKGRGPAGEKAGNFRFRPKRKKSRHKPFGAKDQRRGGYQAGGEQRTGQQRQRFGKHGGKRKGRR